MATHKFGQAFSGEVSALGTKPDIKAVMDALARFAPRSLRSGGGNVLAAHGIARGVPQSTMDLSAQGLQTSLLERLGGAVSWQPFSAELRCSCSPLRSAPSFTRMSVVVNWKRISQVLASVSQRARLKYDSRMFLHWYERYGFGHDSFTQAFEVLEDVIGNYSAS